MLKCKKYQNLISCALDGALDADEQRALSHHLEQCSDCRRVYAQMQKATKAMQQSAVEPPAELLEGVMRSVGSKVPQSSKSRRKPYMRYISAAACLAIVLLIGFAALHNGVSGADNMEKASAPESFYSADSALNDVYESETLTSDDGGAWMEPTELESVTEESENDFNSSDRGIDNAESQANCIECIELDGVLYSYDGHTDTMPDFGGETLSYDELILPEELNTDPGRNPLLCGETLLIPDSEGGWFTFSQN